jgi:CRP/FNR family transcriptional regulator, cyclic AMP receptor protein
MTVIERQKTDYRAFARLAGVVIPYSAGSRIFAEGDKPNHMYVLLSGAVEVSAHGHVIEEIQPGDALGVLSLLDSKPRSATAIATADSELAVIDERRFRFMIEETPGFVWYVLEELAHRLRSTNAALS